VERHYAKVSVGLALLVAVYYVLGRKAPLPWLTEMKEYVSFIILLSSLFAVSGGISIRINRLATPITNATLLLVGALVANVFGTTGAAMLLIRPFLRMNRGHIKPYHVVFFIFIVANVGGSLTPIGDPPLFLGYLKGVPFWWVGQHMGLYGRWRLVSFWRFSWSSTRSTTARRSASMMATMDQPSRSWALTIFSSSA